MLYMKRQTLNIPHQLPLQEILYLRLQGSKNLLEINNNKEELNKTVYSWIVHTHTHTYSTPCVCEYWVIQPKLCPSESPILDLTSFSTGINSVASTARLASPSDHNCNLCYPVLPSTDPGVIVCFGLSEITKNINIKKKDKKQLCDSK